jgi:hypothetical protein
MTPFIAIFLMRGSPLTRFEITVIYLTLVCSPNSAFPLDCTRTP